MLIYHIDLKRAMWKMDYFIEYGRTLSGMGYSHILLEIEDKFRFRRHPDLAHADAFSAEKFSELADACRGIGLEPIPLWQTLGHAESVVGKPAYAHLREQESVDSQYDPASGRVYSLLKELIDEQIDSFRPKEFFHLGADETWKLGTSLRLLPVVRDAGVGGLYLRHMLPLFEHVLSRGLKPVIWADMVLSHPGILKDIPREVVMMDWDYHTGSERPRKIRLWGLGAFDIEGVRQLRGKPVMDIVNKHGIDSETRSGGTFRGFFYADALRDMGFEVITASANRCSGDSVGTPFNPMHLPNVFFSARKGRGFLGNAVTSWAVRHNHPETHWPANFAAVRGWRGADSSYDEDRILRDFTAARYGLESEDFPAAMEKACLKWNSGQASSFPARDEALKSGRNPFEPDIRELADGIFSPSLARARLEELRTGYESAREIFSRIRSGTGSNERELDFWLEGIDFNIFHADCLVAAIDGDRKSSAALGKRLADMEAASRGLFSLTYEPASVDEEIELRYGFLRRWLERTAA